jgi:hypothetical protein
MRKSRRSYRHRPQTGCEHTNRTLKFNSAHLITATAGKACECVKSGGQSCTQVGFRLQLEPRCRNAPCPETSNTHVDRTCYIRLLCFDCDSRPAREVAKLPRPEGPRARRVIISVCLVVRPSARARALQECCRTWRRYATLLAFYISACPCDRAKNSTRLLLCMYSCNATRKLTSRLRCGKG